MECYVVKYDDGQYMNFDYYYDKGSWQEAYKYIDEENAEEFVETQKKNKQAFIKDQTGYVKGISPESFDCRVVKWIIQEN